VAHKCLGKSKFITAKANSSRQEQIHHSKRKLSTARANWPWQEQITHGKSKLPTARANYPGQEQIHHGKEVYPLLKCCFQPSKTTMECACAWLLFSTQSPKWWNKSLEIKE
jgi:hypothetical protein